MGDLPRQPDLETLLLIAEELLCDGCVRRPLTKKLRRLFRRVTPRLLSAYDVQDRLQKSAPAGCEVPPKPRLSACEAEVAAMVYSDKTNKEIADELGKNIRTVVCQVAALFHKFGVKRRTALVRRFAEIYRGARTCLFALLASILQEAAGWVEFLV